MKTVIFIHGGESFVNQDEYQKFLSETYVLWQSEPWSDVIKTSWSQVIAKKCSHLGIQVFMPIFPNKLNAKYKDWKIVFEWLISRLGTTHELTLIGSSLGGCFLLKYFSEISESHFLLKSVEKIHLIAACIEVGDFTAPKNYDNLNSLGDKVHIWHAEDDNIVPFSVAKELEKSITKAQVHFFSSDKWYGHFYKMEQFEELETEIL